ncbi:MAG: hypothetical protein K2R98_05825 [Gemmataceae bacterium]|nr:hypothetical protein [Gemmataceae bacterium]
MNTQNPRITMPEVKKQSEGVAGAVSETAANVKDKVKDTASSMVETAGRAWESTKEAAQDFGSSAVDRAQDFQGDVVSFIRRYPMACIGGALGIGFLLGQMAHFRE